MGNYIDITNQRFGKLVALYPTRLNGRFAWHCLCDCGNEKDVESNNLRNNKVQSCGCATATLIGNKVSKNLIGKVFGRLTVKEKTNKRQSGAIVWKCLCQCGNEIEVATGNLTSNHTTSCGCLRNDNKFHEKLSLQIKGQTFGMLTVQKYLYPDKDKRGSMWLCTCKCGNTCEALGQYLVRGLKSSCGCLKSKGEQKIAELLQQNNIKFESQKSFETCRFSDTNYLAFFDFYVNNEYLIEFDGEQHFSYRNVGWSTEEQYLKTKEHDEFKTKWCKENNIPLIRIKYTQLETLTIEDLLLNKENNNG